RAARTYPRYGIDDAELPRTPIFFFNASGDRRGLHSFPTRRSSDLSRLESFFVETTRDEPDAHVLVDVETVDVADDDRFLRDEYIDRKSTRLNSSHLVISYAVFCLKKKQVNIDWVVFSDTGVHRVRQ